MKVFGISVVTDLGVENHIMEVNHLAVQEAADNSEPNMTLIFKELIEKL
jgi:purine-nucleoside phosphorylase